MGKKIFKKPSLRKRVFGVDKDGRDGLTSYFRDWAGQSHKNLTNENNATPMIATALIGGMALYGICQIVEYGSSMNARPNLPEQHLLDVSPSAPISMISLYANPTSNVSDITSTQVSARELFLVHDPVNGTYEISECKSSCTALSASDVIELRGEFRAMADDHDLPYLSPEFMFPLNISYISEPIYVEDMSDGLFADDSREGDTFYISEEPRRFFSADGFSVESRDQRLNSEFVDFDVEGVTELWRAALASPDNGTYQIINVSQDAEDFVWPRIEGDEWRDTIVSENAAYTVLALYGLMASIGIGATAIGSVGRTREKVRPLTGFEMLKHKPK